MTTDSGEIDRVAQAVEMLLDGGFSDIWSTDSDHTKLPEAKYPIGLWFRGQGNADWLLRPGVFRATARGGSSGKYYDETSAFHHFRLRQPSFEGNCRSTFDWLAVMQHHGLPTRLLDWSESILVGLFFAVSDPSVREHPGRLFGLDARKLNYISGFDMPRPELAIPEEFDVVLRSEMAASSHLDKLLQKESVRKSAAQYPPSFQGMPFEQIETLVCEGDAEVVRRLCSPIAVFPKRTHGRMVFQSSMFTLHGGKRIWTRPESSDFIPTPTHLNNMNSGRDEGERFLKSYTIPCGAKERILSELHRLGIHEGSLFPEPDFQSRYVQHYWTFELEDGCGDP